MVDVSIYLSVFMLTFITFLEETKFVLLILEENMGHHVSNLKLYVYKYLKYLLLLIFILQLFNDILPIYKA